MKSWPSAQVVQDDLGDKIIEAFAEAVDGARNDLRDYRRGTPNYVAESSERGLANWIHDRLWHHLVHLLDDVPHVDVVEHGPTRELFVGLNYRVRAKRHSEDGAVSTYPTQTALLFMEQGNQPTFEGMEIVNLIVGYTWLAEARSIGGAVLSLRDASDHIIWQSELSRTTQVVELDAARDQDEEQVPGLPNISLSSDHKVDNEEHETQ
jgi:hypothetical protein